MVLRDGNRIVGLGDFGVQEIGILIRKLYMY